MRYVTAAIAGVGRCLTWLAALTVAFFMGTPSAFPMEAAPHTIEAPLPDEWRAPFREVLKKLVGRDSEEALNATKAESLEMLAPELHMLALRIELPNLCSNDRDVCLTIAGRLANGAFVNEAMFAAGKKINFGDVISDFNGVRSFPARFYSRDTVVVLYRTGIGVLVVLNSKKQPGAPP